MEGTLIVVDRASLFVFLSPDIDSYNNIDRLSLPPGSKCVVQLGSSSDADLACTSDVVSPSYNLPPNSPTTARNENITSGKRY